MKDPSDELSEGSASRGSGTFSLVGLLVLIACCCAFLAVGVKWAQRARESARRSECTINLKQIGLGAHNFHDTNNGLPPLALGPGRASFWVMIHPFCESGSRFDVLVQGRNAGRNTDIGLAMTENWDRLNQAEQEAIGSIDYMTCPSRRSPPQLRAKGLGRGPLGDYAVVFVPNKASSKDRGDAADEENDPWHHYFYSYDDQSVDKQLGLIRLAVIDQSTSGDDRFRGWKPRDTLARAAKAGTTNVLMAGEKHLRKNELGKCCSKDATDGSFLHAMLGWQQFNVARNIRHRFGRGPHDDGPGTDPADGVGFGSYHSGGVINFLRGDGSVVELHPDTDLEVRVYLGIADKDDLAPEFDPAAIKKRLRGSPPKAK